MSTTPTLLANLRHLYENMVNGGVRDTASAKRIAEGLLSPAIAELERAALTQGAGEAVEPAVDWACRLAEDFAADCVKAGYVTTNAPSREALRNYTAQQLQQAVAREREECAAMAEGAFFGNPGDLGWEIAAAIRAKGTHD